MLDCKSRVMDSTTPSPIKPGRKHKHGQVLVVGSGDCGQLGLGNSIFSASKPKLLSYFNDKSIYNVFAGGLHNIALSTSGSLYSWGCNDLFALGRSKSKPEDEPLPVEGLDNIVIVQVACGDSISCALDDKGYVYNWGTFRNNSGVFGVLDGKSDPESGDQAMVIPARVMQLKNIIKIAAGSNHLVALSSDGKVYTWGTGEQASLIPRAINFKPPNHKKSSKFVNVFCGGYTTFLLHESNTVYAFGLNNYGQLGVDEMFDEEMTVVPQPVVGLDPDFDVIQISGGEHHTIALLSNGKVYSCGRSDSGQTGFKSEDPKSSFELVNSITDPAIRISAGASFSLVVTDTSNNPDAVDGNKNLWGMGYGEMGQLANDQEDMEEPEIIDLKSRTVYAVAAGGQHTLMLLNVKE